MKQNLILLLIVCLSSCDLSFREAPTDPGPPYNPIIKSIPFVCDGGEFYVKMDVDSILKSIGPELVYNNNLYLFAPNKLTIIDCNQFKVLKTYDISSNKIYSIYSVYPSTGGRFWLLHSNYYPNTTYQGNEVLSLVDTTGHIINSINFSSNASLCDLRINTTKSGGCLVRLTYEGNSTLYNYDKNGTEIWMKNYTIDYKSNLISTKIGNTIELSTGEFLYTTFIENHSLYSQGSIAKLIKMTKDGNFISSISISGRTKFEYILQQSDTSYLLFNENSVIKFDSTLTYQKEVKSGINMYSSLTRTHDGNLMICYSVGSNGWDIALSKLGDDLMPEWTQTYGGTGCEYPIYYTELSSGSFFILGITENLTGNWRKTLISRTESPYYQYYLYDEEKINSYYIIKTDKMGIACK